MDNDHPSFKQFFTGTGIDGASMGGGFGGMTGLLLLLALGRGGLFRDGHGCEHKCSTEAEAQAILNRLNTNEVQDIVRQAQACTDGRISDLANRIADGLGCVKEKVGYVGDSLRDFAARTDGDLRRIDGKLCHIDGKIEAGFTKVETLFRVNALESENKAIAIALAESRRREEKYERRLELCDLEDRLSRRRSRDHHDGPGQGN